MDKNVRGQEPVGSASVSHREIIHHNMSHWQSAAAQDMVAIGDFGTAGRQFRTATKQQVAEAAQNFGNTPRLQHSQDALAGGSFGRAGQPYITGHHNAAEGDVHVLRGQGRDINWQQRPVAVGEISSPDNCHGRGGIRGDLTAWSPDVRNSLPNTEKEGHSASGLTWNSCNTNGDVATTPGLCRFRPNDHISGERYCISQRGQLVAQGLRNGYGSAMVPENLNHQFGNSLSMPDSHQASADYYNADGQPQSSQNSHKGFLAAQSCHNGQSGTCDAGGQLHPFAGREVPTEGLEEQKNLVVGRDLLNAQTNMYDAKEHGSLAPQKLCDVHGSGQLPADFRPNAPPNVFNQPTQLPEKVRSSDRIAPCFPALHHSVSSTASPVAIDHAAFQHHHHDDHHYNKHQHDDLSTTSSPGFYSQKVSSISGRNAPSVGRIPYVAISGSSTTNALCNNTNSLAAPSRRFDPQADTLPFTDPSPSSTSTIPSSSSKNHIATMFPPHGIVITDADMELAMAYCFDRGNGQYTRLVPIDILPFSLRDLPARVSSHEGMIVLPVPRMVDPDVQPGNVQLSPYVSGNNVTVSSAAIVSLIYVFLHDSGRWPLILSPEGLSSDRLLKGFMFAIKLWVTSGKLSAVLGFPQVKFSYLSMVVEWNIMFDVLSS